MSCETLPPSQLPANDCLLIQKIELSPVFIDRLQELSKAEPEFKDDVRSLAKNITVNNRNFKKYCE